LPGEPRSDVQAEFGINPARTLVEWNRRVCWALTPHLPQAKIDLEHLNRRYEELLAEAMSTESALLVVDAGAGKESRFVRGRSAVSAAKVVGVDVSADELALNRDVDEKCVVDVETGLPFETGSVDVVTSNALLEHLPDVEAFIAHSARVLRPGGRWLHLFTSKFAPFAIVNQLLPDSVAERVLDVLLPHQRQDGTIGFRAYYDRCYASALRKLLYAHGFDVVTIRPSYSQSYYFDFLIPLFLLSASYEAVVARLGATNLAAYLLVDARRRAA
jgi:ubiquinone/menaquinone biosynthesis C-methylase UbiE